MIPRALIFALLVVSVWIQRSNTAATGQAVSARDGNHPLHASLSEPFGIPIPYRGTVKKIAQELRKSQDPTNAATQDSGLEQALFLDLPADPPQIHEIHKRVLEEFTDDSARDNERYDSEFPLRSNGNEAEVHSRDRDRQNENEIHKRITSILADVTRRNNDRYDNEFPLRSNGNEAEVHSRDRDRQNENEIHNKITSILADVPHTDNEIHAEVHNRINGRHVEDENEIYEKHLKEDNCMKNGRGDGTCGGGRRGTESGGRRCKDGNRREGTSRKKIAHKGGRNKCKDEVITRKKLLVVDKVNPERFKIIEVPITEDVIDFNLSDEALEALGDKISSPIDITKIKEIKGYEAQKRLQDSKKENEEKDENEGENEDVLEKNYN